MSSDRSRSMSPSCYCTQLCIGCSNEREKESAVEEIRKEFAGLAISAAERIVEQSLDDKAHGELIDKVLEEGLGDRKN